MDLPGVVAISDLHSAIKVKERIAGGKVEKAIIVGAGAIGCELAEALSDLWGIETRVMEIEHQILPGILDRSLARIIRTHMEEKGVSLHLGQKVIEIRKNGETGLEVVTGEGPFEADLVIMAVGVHPNSELARDAGLLLSPRGAIVVNGAMQTSDPDIYAGGDCVEIPHLITGKPVFFPQGSLANRQGRIIGTNIAGGSARFDGTVGSFAIKIFDLAVASTGITPQTALKEGFQAEAALVVQADRAHFYPEQELIFMQITVDRKTRRVLGVQAVGKGGDAVVGRINAVASILPFRPTVEDISNLEIAYSPPFASALDIVNAAANTAENMLDGLNRPVGPEEFERFLREASEDTLCLDIRSPANAEPYVKRFGDRWVNIPQETLNRRMDEVPKDKRLLVLCNAGGRSYEALRQLDHAGFRQAVNVEGGLALIKTSGLLKSDDEKE
jgi:NADPH-dependent 2,4-dienoyl-CoA reductase/sulfur reductase-like enzyme/rhodanese-related sulfurtransferase